MNVRNRNGTSMVEFAIILPLLCVIMFGIIEFGLVLYDKAVITNASREAARYGIVSRTPRRTVAEITGVVNDYCQNYLVTFGASNNPVTSVTGAGSAFGLPLSVNVTYNYGFLALPNFVTSVTGPLSLSATTVMRME